jgi:hypothetical protein
MLGKRASWLENFLLNTHPALGNIGYQFPLQTDQLTTINLLDLLQEVVTIIDRHFERVDGK